MEQKAISLIYRDLPNDKDQQHQQGWENPAWLALTKKGQLRVKAQTIPGMFGYPDLYISHHEFILHYKRAEGQPLHFITMLTLYTEKTLNHFDKARLEQEASIKAGAWLDKQNL